MNVKLMVDTLKAEEKSVVTLESHDGDLQKVSRSLP